MSEIASSSKMSPLVPVTAVYSIIVGFLYILAGVLELLVFLDTDLTIGGVAFAEQFPLMGDVFMAFGLFVTAGIFWAGILPLLRKEETGPAYPLVGTGLAVILAGIQVLTMLANWAQKELLQNDDFAEWVPSDDLTVSVYLVIFTFFTLYPVLKRDQFFLT
jgi:hypothetical protein